MGSTCVYLDVKRKEENMETYAAGMEEAKAQFGLEKYSDLDASMILGLAGGTEDYEIDWGIKLWENGKKVIERGASEHS